MLVANGRPSTRIQPVVEEPTCVAALILVVASHAFQAVPPIRAFFADEAQNASALAKLEPIAPGTSVPTVVNTMFLLGLKCATAVRSAETVSVHVPPCDAQSPSQAPKSDPLVAAAVIRTLVPMT
jgi:hypothetical protein